MNDLCSGCGRPPHPGGCKLVATQPAPLSDVELQKRQDYLQSDEFKRDRDASLAARNPAVVETLPGATTAISLSLAQRILAALEYAARWEPDLFAPLADELRAVIPK